MSEKNSSDVRPTMIGNVYDERFGTGFGGAIWDKNMISPTLHTGASASQQFVVVCAK